MPRLASENISYLQPTWMGRTCFIDSAPSSDAFHTFLSQFTWYVNYSWPAGDNLVAGYSFGQYALLSPDSSTNMLSPCPCCTCLLYFTVRELCTKNDQWTLCLSTGNSLFSSCLGCLDELRANTRVRQV